MHLSRIFGNAASFGIGFCLGSTLEIASATMVDIADIYLKTYPTISQVYGGVALAGSALLGTLALNERSKPDENSYINAMCVGVTVGFPVAGVLTGGFSHFTRLIY